jgi:nicotinamide-nucleotide amidase
MPNPQATVQRDEVTAGVIVTGTEVLSGQVTDRNGPWIS